MTRQVFDNHMTAHVWAQGRQDSGRSGNGNLYFGGPFLFSYGRHYVAGIRLPDGRGLINADSYSVSTGKHTSYAAQAFAHGAYAYLPGLTRVANILAHCMGPTADARAQELARVKLARHFATGPDDITGPFNAKGMQWAFEALGLKEAAAAKAAAKAAAQWAAKAAKDKAAKDKAARDAMAADAKALAARPLAESIAQADALARDVAALALNRKADDLREYRALKGAATHAFRASKEAKARNWTRVAAACRAHWQAFNAGAKAAEKRARARNAQRYVVNMVLKARGYEALLAGRALPGDFRAGETDWRIASAAEMLFAFSQSRFVARAALFGVDSKALAAKIEATAAALKERAGVLLAATQAANERAENRRLVALIRKARAAAAKGEAMTLADGKAIESALPDLNLYGGRGRRDVRRAFRVAGFDAPAFDAMRDALQDSLAAFRAREIPLRLAAWRDCAPDGRAPAYTEGGGVYLRARGVQRDTAGAIIGGTLETSRGAQVPLAHAIRAFRFLKLCRDKGEAWESNGRTLPVGHFRIDRVEPNGDFRAGCHFIQFAEVAALAARLGVQELAAADTREGVAHAHA